MSTEDKNAASRPASRSKTGLNISGQYNTMVQSLLDIWNVLAAADAPLTAKEIGDRLKKKGTSPQTAERRLNDSIDLINAVFPHTVLHKADQPTILHTYPHDGALHVVVEDSVGTPLWSGNMSAVFQESAVNSIPQSTLNRKLPEMSTDYDDMKLAVKKKKLADHKELPDPRESENVIFMEDYPPLSLAAVVETKKNGRKVVLSCLDYEKQQEKLPPDKRVAKSPPRKFYLESILSPEEWQLLSDVLLVYPYISEQETDKLLSALRRMAPGSRQWHKLIHAPKNPNAVRFDFIRQLEEAIQNQHKIRIKYGRYQLAYQLGGWKPKLQPDSHGYYLTNPYALTWSNGYYYLVGLVEKKDENGVMWTEMHNFRVDRIMELKSTTLSFEKEDFDVYQYRDRAPVMYPGEVVPIKLKCHTRMLSVLMDFFGSAITSYSAPQNDHTIVELEATEKGTKLFALQYVGRVEVLEPRSLRDEVAETLRAAMEDYT